MQELIKEVSNSIFKSHKDNAFNFDLLNLVSTEIAKDVFLAQTVNLFYFIDAKNLVFVIQTKLPDLPYLTLLILNYNYNLINNFNNEIILQDIYKLNPFDLNILNKHNYLSEIGELIKNGAYTKSNQEILFADLSKFTFQFDTLNVAKTLKWNILSKYNSDFYNGFRADCFNNLAFDFNTFYHEEATNSLDANLKIDYEYVTKNKTNNLNYLTPTQKLLKKCAIVEYLEHEDEYIQIFNQNTKNATLYEKISQLEQELVDKEITNVDDTYVFTQLKTLKQQYTNDNLNTIIHIYLKNEPLKYHYYSVRNGLDFKFIYHEDNIKSINELNLHFSDLDLTPVYKQVALTEIKQIEKDWVICHDLIKNQAITFLKNWFIQALKQKTTF